VTGTSAEAVVIEDCRHAATLEQRVSQMSRQPGLSLVRRCVSTSSRRATGAELSVTRSLTQTRPPALLRDDRAKCSMTVRSWPRLGEPGRTSLLGHAGGS